MFLRSFIYRITIYPWDVISDSFSDLGSQRTISGKGARFLSLQNSSNCHFCFRGLRRVALSGEGRCKQMRLTAYVNWWGLALLALGLVGLIFLTCGISANQLAVPIYDSATVVTITGTVQAVEQHQCSLGWRGQGSKVIHSGTWVGTHAILRTEYGILDVHLGPAAFLNRHHFSLAKDDQIEVTGSKFAGHLPVLIIAKELKRGQSFLELRDNTGKPLWIDDRSPVSRSGPALTSFSAALTESNFHPIPACICAVSR